MAGNLQSQWSTTAATNASADSTIAMSSGTLFSADHGAGRAIMARVAAMIQSLNGTISSTGSANAYAFASPAGHTYAALAAGMRIAFKANFSNTSTVTLAVDGLTAKAVTKYGATALAANDLLSGMVYDFVYDGTEWIVLNPGVGNIGSGTYQPLDATLTALAALTITANTYILGTGADAFSVTSVTAAAQALLADASVPRLASNNTWTGINSWLNTGGGALALRYDAGIMRLGASQAAAGSSLNFQRENNAVLGLFDAFSDTNIYNGKSTLLFSVVGSTGVANFLNGPTLSGAASPTSIYAMGYLGAPATGTPNSAYTMVLADAGGTLYHDEVTARVWTIPSNASVPYPIGTVIIGDNTGNSGAAGVLTLSINSDTLRRGDGTAGTGSRTIAALGVFAFRKTKATEWVITGSGIT